MIQNSQRKYVMLNLFLKRGGWSKAEYLKKKKVFHSMGNNCYYHPWQIPAEPHLVSFGDNVFVASGVSFLTHNMANCVFNNDKVSKMRLWTYADKIEIGNNVFIGAKAMIMGGGKDWQ